MTMPSTLDLVAEFHRAFQLPINTAPTFEPNLCALRIRLLLEEYNELMVAIRRESRVDMLDALCDLQYVLSGAILSLGLREMYEAHTAHLDYIPMSALSVMAPKISLTVRGTMLSIKIKLLDHLLAEKAIEAAVVHLSGCQDIIDGIIDVAGFRSVFADAFIAVHQNNMDKLWSRSDVMSDNWPDLRFSESYGRYIARDVGGKIIKPVGHTKVDLTPFAL